MHFKTNQVEKIDLGEFGGRGGGEHIARWIFLVHWPTCAHKPPAALLVEHLDLVTRSS